MDARLGQEGVAQAEHTRTHGADYEANDEQNRRYYAYQQQYALGRHEYPLPPWSES